MDGHDLGALNQIKIWFLLNGMLFTIFYKWGSMIVKIFERGHKFPSVFSSSAA